MLEDVMATFDITKKLLKKRFPTVEILTFGACSKCKERSYIFPVIDMTTGYPKMEFGCTLYVPGERESAWLRGGNVPLPGKGIQVHDGGLRVVTIRVTYKLEVEEVRRRLFLAANKLLAA